MTLILKLDLDMIKMYHHTKNEVSMSRHSKVIAQTETETQTDRQTHTHRQTHRQHNNITFPYSRAVKMSIGTVGQITRSKYSEFRRTSIARHDTWLRKDSTNKLSRSLLMGRMHGLWTLFVA